jgi:hypothetical protein
MLLRGRRLAERAAPVQSWMKQRHHARLPVAVAALRTRQARAGVCDAERAGPTGAVEMLCSTLLYTTTMTRLLALSASAASASASAAATAAAAALRAR